MLEASIKVFKGSVETTILKKNLKLYLTNGWSQTHVEEKPAPKTYDEYTVVQLRDIAKNRNLYFPSRVKKQGIIDRLIVDDEHRELTTKPSNKGFTDNLIIEE
jgi:hypothetical protein